VSVLTTIADAIVTLLNAAAGESAPLGEDFAAERVYLPEYDSAAAAGLSVQVFCTSIASNKQAGTRANAEQTYTVRVAVYERVDQEDDDRCDELQTFVEKIHDLLRTGSARHITVGSDQASLVDPTSIDVPYDPAHLQTHSTFASLVTLNYRLLR
jgi:protein-disulfide isomerase